MCMRPFWVRVTQTLLIISCMNLWMMKCKNKLSDKLNHYLYKQNIYICHIYYIYSGLSIPWGCSKPLHNVSIPNTCTIAHVVLLIVVVSRTDSLEFTYKYHLSHWTKHTVLLLFFSFICDKLPIFAGIMPHFSFVHMRIAFKTPIST